MQKLLFILLLLPFSVFAHGGDEHGSGKQAPAGISYFHTEAVSDKYELLLKYEAIIPGEPARLRLFISNYKTNQAIDSDSLRISSPELPGQDFTVTRSDEGIYEISGIFPEKKTYSLRVGLNASLGPDLLLLQHIEAGKPLAVAGDAVESRSLTSAVLLFAGGLLAGLAVMFFVMKARNKRANTTMLVLLIALLSIPLGTQPLAAHEADESGTEKTGSSGSASFDIPKETQFLFNVYTRVIEAGAFTESIKLFGTVVPSSNGQALVQVPQNGRIMRLDVHVGQEVKKGQVLAVIEQNVDAGTQVGLLSERNNAEAEYLAAKKDYERLKSIEDIAARKDVAEAEARYRKAESNRELFAGNNSGEGANARMITLRSPIDGRVGNFNFSTGATVNANETIFNVTNLSRVYIEAQVFDKDAEHVKPGMKYTVECTANDVHKTAEVKLLAMAQSINPSNQSQRVLFEMENPGGEFKIGEFVNIRVFAQTNSRQMAVPNSAISEINGKPVVFVKDHAEQYRVAYVSTAENNGSFTVIGKGIEEKERIVVNGTYQLKMIYLNQ